MPTRRHPNVVHCDEVEPTEISRGSHRLTRRQLGAAAANRQLGASLCELPPGARSYPLHWHGANEESIYVLSGGGTARIGTAEVAIRAGDWVAFPVGPEHAHQLVNDGEAPLVYLCVSTDHRCEVIGYPDSNKLRLLAGETWNALWADHMTRPVDSLDYWDGEPEA